MDVRRQHRRRRRAARYTMPDHTLVMVLLLMVLVLRAPLLDITLPMAPTPVQLPQSSEGTSLLINMVLRTMEAVTDFQDRVNYIQPSITLYLWRMDVSFEFGIYNFLSNRPEGFGQHRVLLSRDNFWFSVLFRDSWETMVPSLVQLLDRFPPMEPSKGLFTPYHTRLVRAQRSLRAGLLVMLVFKFLLGCFGRRKIVGAFSRVTSVCIALFAMALSITLLILHRLLRTMVLILMVSALTCQATYFVLELIGLLYRTRDTLITAISSSELFFDREHLRDQLKHDIQLPIQERSCKVQILPPYQHIQAHSAEIRGGKESPRLETILE